MQTNLPKILSFTASVEGGYQCIRSDDGNWTGGQVGHGRLVGTMRGISAPIMVQWLGNASMVTTQVMKSITDETYRAIAEALFWRPLDGRDLPTGIDLILFDFGFNSSIARAARHLQRVAGLTPEKIDGLIGPETLRAIHDVSIERAALALSTDFCQRFQAELGVSPDGSVGPLTLRAIREQNARNRLLVYACASQQEAAYRSFKKFPEFGRTWLTRLDRRLNAALHLISETALT